MGKEEENWITEVWKWINNIKYGNRSSKKHTVWVSGSLRAFANGAKGSKERPFNSPAVAKSDSVKRQF